MLVNADLHIHSPFSIGSSRFMDLPQLEAACSQKGLQVVGSGDAFHPVWRERCQRYEGTSDLLIIPSVEVEDIHRIHHLIFLEDFPRCGELAEVFSVKSSNITTAGRPRIAASGEEIAGEVHAQGGLIGPAHAFTPWTSLYSRFDRISGCYGEESIDFLELGLSADSSYAAGIPDLAHTPFLSNSDAHRADPVKIGREWNCLRISRLTVPEVLESITRRRIIYNAGFFPQLGKYNQTACCRCYRQYSMQDAISLSWRCPDDGGRIKKGVCDRVKELSTGDPTQRPPYYHCMPLREILQAILGNSSPHTKQCQVLYERLITSLGSEIRILMEIPISEIHDIDEEVGEGIRSLRAGDLRIVAGGGGRYGSVSLKSKHYLDLPPT
jgi:uncharacterized protein (TIGR00375 family)